MQRRSAFLAATDSGLEARDLSEISHEIFGRDLTDHVRSIISTLYTATKFKWILFCQEINLIQRDPNFLKKLWGGVEKGLERVPGLGVGVSVIEGLTSHHKRDEPAEPSGGNENGDHTKGHRKVHEKGDKVHEKGHKVHKKVRKGKGKSKQELGQGTQPQSGSPEAHSPGEFMNCTHV